MAFSPNPITQFHTLYLPHTHGLVNRSYCISLEMADDQHTQISLHPPHLPPLFFTLLSFPQEKNERKKNRERERMVLGGFGEKTERERGKKEK